ncbi:ABC transporter permease [Microbacterium sp. STN6]|uniref:ABC transporter permease n=1 Tax=Microbacterium sp. STN6 TaxID=2995588 RepID=UPI002260A8B7|nr:ABC transporter permease [Microbacterium sp. STN6]MCX7520761.1 ABC transporter permease [Microbacterium sp. STN6]
MAVFVLKRALLAVLTIFAVSVIAFLLVHSMKGDPGTVIAGLGATKGEIAAINDKVGWNDPLIVQYADWALHAIQGDFGLSLIDGRDIMGDLADRLPVTASLATGGTLLSAVLGIVLGVTAVVRGGIADKIVSGYAGLAAALPNFWIGIILVFVFAVVVPVFPATGYVPFDQSPELWFISLALPVLTLAIGGSGFIARQARASMYDALAQEHIRTLRATATPRWRILYIHALRFASLPIIASIALQFIALFGGSVVIEQLYSMPGIGVDLQAAVARYDAPVVLGVVVIATIVVVVVNLILEMATRFLDPKLRAS